MEIPKERPADFDDTKTTSEIAVCVAATVLVIITLILRYLGRWILQKRIEAGKGRSGQTVYGLDDIFNVLSILSFFALIISTSIAIKRGMGQHVSRILYEHGAEGMTNYFKAIFVTAIIYNATLGLIKLSVLSLYLRILRGVSSNALRTVVWIFFAIVAGNTIANVLVCIFQCWPVEAAWDLNSKGRCVDINAFYLGNAITGVSTDAIVYLLSIPIVKPLQMDTKTKLQLLATMLVGGFAVVTSAVRLGFIPALLKDPDVSMAIAIPMNWSIAEPAVGLLVSSMPAIRAIRFLWRKPGEDSYGSSFGGVQTSLRSRSGQIQLVDFGNAGRAESGSTKSIEGGAQNDSGELVKGMARMGTISRTTELEVSYSRRLEEEV